MDSIHLVCPQCRKQFQETFVRLKSGDNITCPECGGAVEYNPDTMAAIEQHIGDSIERLKGSFVKNLKGFKPSK